MSQKAVERHFKDLKEQGLLIVDKNAVEQIPKIKEKIFSIPAIKTAENLF
jgi:Pyruvate/2-oxoacid:ferredoxin oxidoreductase gamma subunit